ncbi:MAG: hypothetical protein P4L46_13845 [Fimbriimonas sp.]|nr:hypothetical protein [Fimbriimonas sp.]
MKWVQLSFATFTTMAALVQVSLAQMGGGSVYNGQQGNPADILRQQRALTDQEIPPTLNSVFLDASVLMNIHADAYVALFGISEEGVTLADARAKVHEKLAKFKKDLMSFGESPKNVFVDFVAQNRIYGFHVDGTVATEQVTGFELKENVSIKCGSQSEVDSLIALAAKDGVFDLIKVDYVLTNLDAVRSKLVEVASQVIHQKKKDYQKLLGVAFRSSPQLYVDRFNAFFPTEMYASYQAAEGDNVNPGYELRNYVVHGARKMRTFYYNPLTGKGFDKVVNPIVTDPVVQCTLYIKLRFESGSDSRLTTMSKSIR